MELVGVVTGVKLNKKTCTKNKDTDDCLIHPQACIDQLYLAKRSGGPRGLIGLGECVRDEEMGLAYYIEKRTERC